MKNLILSLFAVCLVMLLSDCTKEEVTPEPKDPLEFKCFIDKIPDVGDTAIASFLIRFAPGEDPIDALIKEFLKGKIVYTITFSYLNENDRVDTLSDTVFVNALHQEVITEILVTPKVYTGINVLCKGYMNIDYIDTLGDTALWDKHFPNEVFAKGSMGYEITTGDSAEKFNHPNTNLIVGMHARDYNNRPSNHEPATSSSPSLNLLSTDPPPCPVSIVCTTTVVDTTDSLYIYFKDLNNFDYFSGDSSLIFTNILPEDIIVCTVSYYTGYLGRHSVEVFTSNNTTLDTGSVMLVFEDDSTARWEVDQLVMDDSPPTLTLSISNDTFAIEPDTFPDPGFESIDTSIINDDPPPKSNFMLPTALTAIRGHIVTYGPNNSIVSVPRATIEIWDDDETSNDDRLGVTKTALDDGSFYFVIPSYEPNSTQDIYFHIILNGGKFAVGFSFSLNGSFTPYHGYTDVLPEIPANDVVTLDPIIFSKPTQEGNDYFAGAANIYTFMVYGWTFVYADHDPGKRFCWFPADQEGSSSDNNTLFIPYYRRHNHDSVLHEYAHCLMSAAHGFNGSACPESGHSIRRAYNNQCGIDEGWASFFPLRVYIPNPIPQQPPIVDYRDGEYRGDFEIENIGFNRNWARGQSCEGRVAGFLLDLCDGVGEIYPYSLGNEGCDCADCNQYNIYSCEDDEAFESCCECPAGDNLSYSFSIIYDLMWDWEINSVTEFYNRWKSRGHDTTFFLAAAHHNTIDFDLRPDLSPPDYEYIVNFGDRDTVPDEIPDIWIEPCQNPREFFKLSEYVWDEETRSRCDLKYGFREDQPFWDIDDGMILQIVPDPLEICDTSLIIGSIPCHAPAYNGVNVNVFACDRAKVGYGSFRLWSEGESELTEIRICYPGSYKVYINGKLAGQDTTGQPPDCPYAVFVPPDSIEWFLRGQDNVIALEGWGGGPHLKGEFIYTIETSLSNFNICSYSPLLSI